MESGTYQTTNIGLKKSIEADEEEGKAQGALKGIIRTGRYKCTVYHDLKHEQIIVTTRIEKSMEKRECL